MHRAAASLLALLLALAPASRAGADFNGSTGFYELASDLGFDADANFPITVSFWCRPDTISGTDTAFCIDDKADQNRVSVILNAGLPSTQNTASGGVATLLASSKTATAGRWYHVAAILDDTATATFVWVDGSFVGGGSGSTRVLADLDTTALGCSFNAGSAGQNFFDGVITGVAVWSVALTQDEIQGLTQSNRVVYNTRPESLVLYCPPESMDGTTCSDVVGCRGFTKNGTIADSTSDGPLGFPRPGLGSWTPASLTGGVVWLKGDAGYTAGTSWTDQSGAGNDLDVIGTGVTAASAALYGGRTGVVFTADSLYGEPAPVTVAPFYGLSVVKDAGSDSGDVAVWIGDKDLDTEDWDIKGSGGANFWAWSAVSVLGGTDTATVIGPVTEGAGAMSVQWDEATSTSRRIDRAGGQQATNTASNSPLLADRWSIGRREDATPDAPFNDLTVYELWIGTTDPGSAGRILWFLYVKARWGLRSGPWRYELIFIGLLPLWGKRRCDMFAKAEAFRRQRQAA